MGSLIYNLSRFVARSGFRLFCGLKVGGLENVPKDGPLIVCPNHVSYFDPPLVGGCITVRPMWYMARDTLFKVPLFGAFIRRVHAFPVKRGAVHREAYRVFENLVGSGHGVVLFPEGTRSVDGKPQQPKAGSGMLIYRCAGAKVLPARVFGAEKAWPKGGWPRPAKVRVAFGPVLDFSAERALPAEKATYELIARRVMEAIATIKDPAAQ